MHYAGANCKPDLILLWDAHLVPLPPRVPQPPPTVEPLQPGYDDLQPGYDDLGFDDMFGDVEMDMYDSE